MMFAQASFLNYLHTRDKVPLPTCSGTVAQHLIMIWSALGISGIGQ